MTTPPPPPGSGGNQPYDPSNPYPSSGSGTPGSGSTPYGSGSAPYGSGQPPQAPPPGGFPPGGYPQQGRSDKAKILSISSIVLGILGLCCCPAAAVGLVLGIMGKKEYERRGESAQLATIGIAISAIMLVLAIIGLILQATGVIDIYDFDATTS